MHRLLLMSMLLLGVGCGAAEGIAGDSAAAGSGSGPAGPQMPPQAPTPAPASCRGAPYPILLHHGFAGFERIGPVNYFFQVADDLRARGASVYTAEVSPYDETPRRGDQLAREVDRVLTDSGACKISIIAHSQGGLDARYVISTLGYGDRVAALATVGTPHRGTPIAEAMLGLTPGLADGVIDALLSAVQGLSSGVKGQADLRPCLTSMTAAYTAAFNGRNPDDRRVAYYSVAGRTAGRKAEEQCQGGLWPNPWQVDITEPLIALPEAIIAGSSGSLLRPVPNDGIVPTASARWGKFLGCVPADHFDEVGQIARLLPDPLSGFSHKDLYRRLLNQLRDDGF